MIKILFKNVGQGDSILLEWQKDGETHYGIIDCNLYEDGNPLLEEITSRKIKHFDFIILSHLHYDHYSGFSELLEYLIDKKISSDLFLHTFTTELIPILNILNLSQKQQKNTAKLLDNIQTALDKEIIKEIDDITHNFNPINLYSSIELSFLAPIGNDYIKLARQRSNYEHKRSKVVPDFNTMSTIIQISSASESIILTSDATRKSFKRIIGKIKTTANLVQVPHHGSAYNSQENFWASIKKIDNCPSLFSVGLSIKDKLPNKEVVEFFDKEGYYNRSTNFVYGISEYYGSTSATVSTKTTNKSLYLSTFANTQVVTQRNTPKSDRFSGDQLFEIDLQKLLL